VKPPVCMTRKQLAAYRKEQQARRRRVRSAVDELKDEDSGFWAEGAFMLGTNDVAYVKLEEDGTKTVSENLILPPGDLTLERTLK